VRPSEIGKITLHVTAQSSTGAADASARAIYVTPMGVRREYTSSELIDGGGLAHLVTHAGGSSAEGDGAVVPGSASVVFRATADIMGPSLAGIDHLVRIPSGCGEQTMITYGPMVSAGVLAKFAHSSPTVRQRFLATDCPQFANGSPTVRQRCSSHTV
jgi:CD109 antigen